MSQRWRLRATGVAAAACLVLAGCSGGDPGDDADAGGEVSIEILSNFTTDIPRGQVLSDLIDEFNAEHEGEYRVTLTEETDWNALQLRIRSMISTGDAPDVFMYNHNPSDFSRERSGVLMDWKPILDEDPEWKARFPEAVLDELTVDGGIYGIPGDQGPALMYYHADVLEQAGVSEVPTTWDDYFAMAETLRDQGISAVAMMTADDAWHAMNAFSYFAVEAGGTDVFAPGASLDTPAIVQAAEYTKRLFEYATPDSVGANYSIASANFIAKQAATIFDGTYLNNAIAADLGGSCDVKIAPAPNLAQGVASTPGDFLITDSLNGWGAKKQDDPRKEAAVVAWMKFFTSNESAVRMAVDGQYLMTASLEPTEDDLARAGCQMAQIIEVANASTANVPVMTRAITPAGQEAVPALLEALILGTVTPEQFAAQLDAANAQE